MGDFRHSLARHRWLAALIVAATLSIRLLVPMGFMPVFADGAVYVELCSGHGVETMAAMPGMAHDRHDHDGSGKDDPSCGFSGHAPASMAGADPILIALAVALILATVFRMPGKRAAPPRRGFLRPPLRGPPAIA